MYPSASRLISEVIQSLDVRAPSSFAENWDNVGLLAGDPNQETQGAIISVDLTAEAIQAAVQQGFKLIINHHPCIFPKHRGLQNVVAPSLIYEAIRQGICVYASHTNFDRCALDVVSRVAGPLGVVPKGRLHEDLGGVGLDDKSGYGFWGEFSSPQPFPDVTDRVKNIFGIHGFWITKPVPVSVARVGFVAGKGSAFLTAAKAVQCDLLITGEIGYHAALAGARQGLAVMELGHQFSEKFFAKTMSSWLGELGMKCMEVSTPTQAIWLGGPL